MAQFDLYVDTYAGTLVSGTTNPAGAQLPRLTQGDTISLRIYLLARTPTYPLTNPFSVINNTSLDLKVAVGQKLGTTSSTLYTQQFTWAKDATNNYFYADLPLNTNAITTLIGAADSNSSAWFEIEYTQGGFPTTIFQQNVTIHAEVIEGVSVTVPAGETALSVEVANNIFLKTRNYGMTLVNPNTGLEYQLYVDDNGTLRCDPIT